jgi:hypothetical protein
MHCVVLKNQGFRDTAPKNGEPTADFSFTTMFQHTGSVLSKDFLANSNVKTLERPPYSPDPAPGDFDLFLRLKSTLEGRCFGDATDVKNATEELKRFSQNGFQESFQHLYVYLHNGTSLKKI